MARKQRGSVAFGSALSKYSESWARKIKVVTVQVKGKSRKMYKVGDQLFATFANAKRVAKGYSSHRKANSVRARCKRGEISKAQAKAKIGYVPKGCK